MPVPRPSSPADVRPLPDGPLHFVGIGGAGQSAIAYVLAQRGRTVRGSDPGISPAAKARLLCALLAQLAQVPDDPLDTLVNELTVAAAAHLAKCNAEIGMTDPRLFTLFSLHSAATDPDPSAPPTFGPVIDLVLDPQNNNNTQSATPTMCGSTATRFG